MRKTSTTSNRHNGAAVTRCAIYTRKSSEEGLEQEFNSLDAQREACEAYILSQKSTGWVALSDMYDDGGISGGTLDRPALQRLLADIAAGRIDTVVVYKVDRLTRSLSDFAKIVDAFDAKGVSFVSVTQQFNTTTSMGRLTLNMLLSFAQFEREVTGERIRDKIAASKQKGMWMGGVVPLGYDVADRKLVVNSAEADSVRHIFQRYATLRSVNALKDELEMDGIPSKGRTNRFGRPSGGTAINRGALYRTGSIAARSSTRASAIPACTKPLLTKHFGTRCNWRWPGTASNGSAGRPQHHLACSPVSSMMRVVTGCRQPTPTRKEPATVIMSANP
jgi:site-specific DNA recombinase